MRRFFRLMGVLTLIFLTLKLADAGVVAAWSWWWVFAPLWVPAALISVSAWLLYMAEAKRGRK